jgi:hypothetical protein
VQGWRARRPKLGGAGRAWIAELGAPHRCRSNVCEALWLRNPALVLFRLSLLVSVDWRPRQRAPASIGAD